MHSLSTQHHAYQSFSFRVTSWFGSVCFAVTRWENFRQNVYWNMDYSFLTTMNERDFKIHTVVTSNGADKVNYHENYLKQKL